VPVELRARLSIKGREFLFETPQAYMRLKGRAKLGGNEIWVSVDGNAISFDVRKIDGRMLLRPAEAIRDLRGLMDSAKGLAAAGYVVNIRMRGVKIMTIDGEPRASR